MADKKKMSVEDILAACRTGDGDSGPEKAAPKADTPAEPAAPKADTPKAPAKKPGEMSAADILAAARGGSKPKADAPAKKPSEMSPADILAAARGGGAAKKADKPKVAKPAAGAKPAGPKADAKPTRSGPMDTSSILAAARSGDKPGPMSKAEAAKKGVPAGGKAKPVLPPMPEKPAYAKAKPAAAAKGKDDRRGFMAVLFGSSLAIGFASLSATGLAWTLGVARFMFPNVLIEPPSRFKVGFPTDFAAGTVAAQFKAQFGVWVTNVEYEGQQQIVALKTVCTHLGCTPNWLEAEQKFKCPCHGSGFYKDGVNFEGPAPRPLERYAIRVADDGQIEIDKSKTFQEQIGQWKDPACFVPV